jgi:hypothetical protein
MDGIVLNTPIPHSSTMSLNSLSQQAPVSKMKVAQAKLYEAMEALLIDKQTLQAESAQFASIKEREESRLSIESRRLADLNQTLMEKEKLLAAREKELVNQQIQLRDLTEQEFRKLKELNSKSITLDQQSSSVLEKEQEIESLVKEIEKAKQSHKSWLEQSKQDMQQSMLHTQNEIREAEQQVRLQESRLVQRSQQLDERESEMAKQSSVLQVRQASLDSRQADLLKQEAQLIKTSDEIESLKAFLDDAKSAIEVARKELHQRETELEVCVVRCGNVQLLKQQLDAKEKKFDEQTALLNQQKAQLQNHVLTMEEERKKLHLLEIDLKESKQLFENDKSMFELECKSSKEVLLQREKTLHDQQLEMISKGKNFQTLVDSAVADQVRDITAVHQSIVDDLNKQLVQEKQEKVEILDLLRSLMAEGKFLEEAKLKLEEKDLDVESVRAKCAVEFSDMRSNLENQLASMQQHLVQLEQERVLRETQLSDENSRLQLQISVLMKEKQDIDDLCVSRDNQIQILLVGLSEREKAVVQAEEQAAAVQIQIEARRSELIASESEWGAKELELAQRLERLKKAEDNITRADKAIETQYALNQEREHLLAEKERERDEQWFAKQEELEKHWLARQQEWERTTDQLLAQKRKDFEEKESSFKSREVMLQEEKSIMNTLKAEIERSQLELAKEQETVKRMKHDMEQQQAALEKEFKERSLTNDMLRKELDKEKYYYESEKMQLSLQRDELIAHQKKVAQSAELLEQAKKEQVDFINGLKQRKDDQEDLYREKVRLLEESYAEKSQSLVDMNQARQKADDEQLQLRMHQLETAANDRLKHVETLVAQKKMQLEEDLQWRKEIRDALDKEIAEKRQKTEAAAKANEKKEYEILRMAEKAEAMRTDVVALRKALDSDRKLLQEREQSLERDEKDCETARRDLEKLRKSLEDGVHVWKQEKSMREEELRQRHERVQEMEEEVRAARRAAEEENARVAVLADDLRQQLKQVEKDKAASEERSKLDERSDHLWHSKYEEAMKSVSASNERWQQQYDSLAQSFRAKEDLALKREKDHQATESKLRALLQEYMDRAREVEKDVQRELDMSQHHSSTMAQQVQVHASLLQSQNQALDDLKQVRSDFLV